MLKIYSFRNLRNNTKLLKFMDGWHIICGRSTRKTFDHDFAMTDLLQSKGRLTAITKNNIDCISFKILCMRNSVLNQSKMFIPGTEPSRLRVSTRFWRPTRVLQSINGARCIIISLNFDVVLLRGYCTFCPWSWCCTSFYCVRAILAAKERSST